MPALTCLVDAAAAPAPPGFGFAADASLPAPGQFPGAPPTTNFPFTDAADVESLPWSPSLSAELYRIDRWGLPYFSANSSGNISVRPHGDATLPHQEIDLLKVIKKASESKSMGGLGLQLPLVVRFPDILKNRLESLQSAFDFAIHSYGYESHYQGVYPVKCNQDRFIVEDIVKFGSPFRFGLEAGSKPELLLAMNCLSKGSPDGLLVCNGFKDAEYISLALIARRLQFNTVIVLELEEELDLVIDLARKFCVRPVIGVRAKLRTKHSGHFGSTSGEKGKFGLNTTQILRVARKLESAGMLDCLQLLHFHIGSQIPSTELLADGVSEGAHVYSELVRLGASMRVIDIGGGLGIDYDGSKSPDSDISVGYTLEEYAATVVGAVQAVCTRKGVQHPILCSESGRAIVSHHSILIFEAVSATAPAYGNADSMVLDGLPDECKADYLSMRAAAMAEEYDSCLIYADKLKQRCVEHFKNGSLCMEQLAAVDALYDFVSNAIGMADPVRTYHVNLSIFTSIPDYWAIGQLFPIMPIHRLEQKPGVRGVLSDLTCDSDGKISRFIGGQNSLMLHELEGDRNGGYAGSGSGRYYLGMFLGGAYQEALGGLHNLFGGPSIVRVTQSDGPHSFAVTRAVPGPSCGDVLRVMQHEPQLMFQTLKHRALELVHIHSSSEEEDVAVEEDDHGILNNAGFLVDSLARSFHNMPYLATAGEEMNVTGYCSDGNFSAMSSEGAISVEDDQWSYMCA